MSVQPPNNFLPDYARPPVVETVLGVQFDRLAKFGNAHLGAFWKTLDLREWGDVTDAPPLPPQFEYFGEAAKWGTGIRIQVGQSPRGRLQIRNAASDRMIQVQDDRIHFNWLGTEGNPYPRYEAVRQGFDDALTRFVGFVEGAKLGEFRPNQWEVTYLNHIPQGTVWNVPADWGFFRPLNGVPAVAGPAAGESFGGEWHFIIPEERGRLHVQWQHAVPSEPSDAERIVLTFTARGPLVPGAKIADIQEGLNLGRNAIVQSFESLMSEAANHYWGLHNGASN